MGFLGASPDGLVQDLLECTPVGLIEVKHIVVLIGEGGGGRGHL